MANILDALGVGDTDPEYERIAKNSIQANVERRFPTVSIDDMININKEKQADLKAKHDAQMAELKRREAEAKAHKAKMDLLERHAALAGPQQPMMPMGRQPAYVEEQPAPENYNEALQAQMNAEPQITQAMIDKMLAENNKQQ